MEGWRRGKGVGRVMKVLMKVVEILGMTVALMAVGNVSAEDQFTTAAPQQISLTIPFPGIPGGGGTTANGGGPGNGTKPDICSNC